MAQTLQTILMSVLLLSVNGTGWVPSKSRTPSWEWQRVPVWTKVADLREVAAYHYNQTHKKLGSTTVIRRLDIKFELEMQTNLVKDRDFQQIPILIFQGNNSRLTLYVNDWNGFGILHYNRFLDGYERVRGRRGKQLLYSDIIGWPYVEVHEDSSFSEKAWKRTRFNRFHVQILNAEKVSVAINGLPVFQWIDRTICPKGEVMDVILDGIGFAVGRSIQNLVINAM